MPTVWLYSEKERHTLGRKPHSFIYEQKVHRNVVLIQSLLLGTIGIQYNTDDV
jgi:hypothetical protein